MRILMTAEVYDPRIGGGIRYLESLNRYFQSAGHTVDIITVGETRTYSIEQDQSGKVIRLPRHFEFGSASISFKYPIALRNLAPHYDIIHFNIPSPSAQTSCLLTTNRSKPPVLLATFHAEVVDEKPFSRLYNALVTRRFLKRMHHIIVASPYLLESSADLLPFRDRCSVIPFGIELNKYATSFEQPLLEVEDSEGFPLVLFVGRLARYKGVEYLVRAMVESPGHLTIIGDGPRRESIEALINDLQLAAKVKLLGQVSDTELLKWYRRADILVLPSIDRGEAFGYVLAEAAAARTALISTDLGTGTSYVNVDGQTGFVVPPRDSHALANAIKSLAQDPEALETMKTNAQERALSNFSEAQMLARTADVYHKLIKGQGK